jgi:AcrR family transcriptional regulator
MRIDRRRQLLEAATALVADLSFQELLGAVSVDRVTERAGVTSGSFFHHFRNRAVFSEAVADQLAIRWRAENEVFAQVMESLQPDELTIGLLRTVAAENWAQFEQGSLPEQQAMLWSTRHQPLSEQTARTGADLLRELYQETTEVGVPHYRRIIAGLGRDMLPPFRHQDLSVALTALVEGLQLRAGVDPDAASPELFADLVSAIILALTQPRSQRTNLEMLELSLAPGEASTELPDADWWARTVEAATPLFEARHPDQVQVVEIASAAGVDVRTIYHHFGSVRAIAAATFVRYVPELRAISARPYGDDEEPEARIEELLLRMVECACVHRGVTEALLDEVLRGTRGATSGRRRIRDLVPLRSMLEPHCRELRDRGRLRTRIDSESLASALLNLCMFRALSRPEDTPERIVDDTSDLVLRGALGP